MENFNETSEIKDFEDIPEILPLLPIRDLVVFPHSVIPLLVGRDKSLAAVEEAKLTHHLILVATQKDSEKENIQAADIHRVGTICRILQVLEFPNGHFKVVVEGLTRARVSRFLRNRDFFQIKIDLSKQEQPIVHFSEDLLKQLLYHFQEYISFTPELPDEILEHLRYQDEPSRMIDFIALNIQSDATQKQKILQEDHPEKRLHLLLEILQDTIGHHRLRQEIDQKVQDNLLKNQRNYYIQEKLRVINKELGEEEESLSPELFRLEEDILAAQIPQPALDKALEELTKLKKIPPFSPEYTVIRNYLDWMIRVPWSKKSNDVLSLNEAERILNEDHFGLEKPKERILEYLAVLQRVKQVKGPLLCFVGPPGVGKTSLGKSISRALGRNFVRISLGGVRDEAEIRGHRRTYIGSMPGKIIQSLKKSTTVNPVFLLDEIDKMSSDFRGDPAAALLEVLDPEQNKNFNDHYLDVDYDLSNIFFITTANVRSSIPAPLQDRMEIIELPGYLEHEKVQIAQLHLIPKQYKAHDLSRDELEITEAAILKIIREYTREAGVRNLERQIASLCRKIIRRLSTHTDPRPLIIDEQMVETLLGNPTYLSRKNNLKPEIGVSTGLAWTSYGGDLIKVEVSVFPGKGKLTLTGKLGEIMRESAQTALSFVRSISTRLEITNESFENNDIHVHLPEGAIPKDGPSAGISMASAMISALSGRPLRNNIAMTGEITLRGKVLAVGGINEKLLAAQRNDLPTIIVPAENHKDIDDLPVELREGLSIIQVNEYQEVLEKVLI